MLIIRNRLHYSKKIDPTVENSLFIDLSNWEHEIHSLHSELQQKTMSLNLHTKKTDFIDEPCSSHVKRQCYPDIFKLRLEKA